MNWNEFFRPTKVKLLIATFLIVVLVLSIGINDRCNSELSHDATILVGVPRPVMDNVWHSAYVIHYFLNDPDCPVEAPIALIAVIQWPVPIASESLAEKIVSIVTSQASYPLSYPDWYYPVFFSFVIWLSSLYSYFVSCIVISAYGKLKSQKDNTQSNKR